MTGHHERSCYEEECRRSSHIAIDDASRRRLACGSGRDAVVTPRGLATLLVMTVPQSQDSDRQCRALVVEDDPAIRRLVEKLLGRHGIEIDAAQDGLVAIEKLRAGSYAVILLDLMLPEASGYEVIEFIKKSGITAPVVVVSAVSQQSLTKLDRDVVKLVISKPFDVGEFTTAVVGLCRASEHKSTAPA